VVENTVNFICTGLFDAVPAFGRVSQCDVQDSSVFRGVDVFTCKHGVSERLDIGFTGELEKRGKNLVIYQVFRVVEEDGCVGGRGGEGGGEFGEPRRVSSK
jgi:hypothetical protein